MGQAMWQNQFKWQFYTFLFVRPGPCISLLSLGIHDLYIYIYICAASKFLPSYEFISAASAREQKRIGVRIIVPSGGGKGRWLFVTRYAQRETWFQLKSSNFPRVIRLRLGKARVTRNRNGIAFLSLSSIAALRLQQQMSACSALSPWNTFSTRLLITYFNYRSNG